MREKMAVLTSTLAKELSSGQFVDYQIVFLEAFRSLADVWMREDVAWVSVLEGDLERRGVEASKLGLIDF